MTWSTDTFELQVVDEEGAGMVGVIGTRVVVIGLEVVVIGLEVVITGGNLSKQNSNTKLSGIDENKVALPCSITIAITYFMEFDPREVSHLSKHADDKVG